jgi:hypothetical protein
MKLLSLNNFKTEKKIKKYIEDINDILKIVTLSQKGLSLYKHYTSVQEMISVLETNKILLELHKKKYEAKLEEIKEKHS